MVLDRVTGRSKLIDFMSLGNVMQALLEAKHFFGTIYKWSIYV